MPLTSLNRIVAILIVGSIPVVWCIFRIMNIASFLNSAGSAGPVIVGFAILAAAMIIGVLIDSISELFTRTLVNRARRSRLISRLFFQEETYNSFSQWMGFFD